MLHKEIPFLRICFPVCAGIITGLYYKPDIIFLSASVALVTTIFLFSLFAPVYRKNTLYGLALTLSLFITGLFLYDNEKKSLSTLEDRQSVFSSTLSDYPEEKPETYLLKIKLNSIFTGSVAVPVNGSMIIYCKKELFSGTFKPGDRLIVRCTPREIMNRGNPYEFDYRSYMENNGIRYLSFINGDDILNHEIPESRSIVHRALIIRHRIVEMYSERGISEKRLPLVAAITLGEKSMLDREQKQNFIKAGIMHVMAVSGLHAIILSLFIFKLLFFLKGRFNIFRIALTILFLWAFAFITGLTPSVLRATLMFTFMQAGSLMQRRVNAVNSVLASAFILILIRPSVIFDAGFLLSYSAVIFIIVFYRDFYLKLCFKKKPVDWIWQSAAVTMIAQAGTLPLTIMLFNRFPTWFILTNVIIVPLTSVVIIAGCLIPLLYPVRILSILIGTALDKLTGLTESLTAVAASLPGSNIENIGMTIPECLILFVIIFVSMSSFLKKKPSSAFFPAFLITLSLLAGTIVDIFTRTSNELIVYSTPGSSTIGIRTGKLLRIYTDTLIIKNEVNKHSSTLGLRTEINQLESKPLFLKVHGKKIMICNELKRSYLQNFPPDYIVCTGLNRQLEKGIRINETADIVFTSVFSVPKQIDLSKADTVHFIKKSGAFITDL